MIGIGGFLLLVVLVALGIEALRWKLRPDARRLRRIKKIGGPPWARQRSDSSALP